ncbi:MAG: PLP-dependent cysteine synthase family protein, partial [Burkholderiaceae bacterium]|nr:PLP-dependent cysteine synthase family protein [Burkholderiaceae bacterium]
MTAGHAQPAGTAWVHRAIGLIQADYQRSADTHLIALPLEPYR